jgi:predicted ester cyclase
MSAEKIKAFEHRWYEEANKGKAALEAFTKKNFDAGYVAHLGTGRDTHGLYEANQVNDLLYEAFPDMHYTLNDLIVEGDKAVVRYTVTGTHKGAYHGVPPTNNKMTVWGIVIDRFVGGKFVESWSRLDTLGLMQQLGVIPTPRKGK